MNKDIITIDKDTTIYIVSIISDRELTEGVTILSTEELSYYRSISASRRRCEWLTSRLLVRDIFGLSVSTTYCEGAPILVGSDSHISISHCGSYLAMMVSRERCGIDMERRVYDFSRVAKRYLSSDELSLFSEGDYGLLWCIKEAGYKKIGERGIDFAGMFRVTEVNYDIKEAIMVYGGDGYVFGFFGWLDFNVCYSR